VRPAVFLDRDGTLIHDVGYLGRLEEIDWYPWTIDALRLLNRAGFLLCVTTNQGGIGLGYYTEAFVRETHDTMARTIEAGGGRIDGWFYCPHHPEARLDALRVVCECRKPGPGMVRQAVERFDIDLARSFVIGDKQADIGLAAGVGAQGVLVRTGHGEDELARLGGSMPGAAHVAPELMAATSWILGQTAGERQA